MAKNEQPDVSKMYADKLGDKQPKGRTDPFGKELDEKGRRFFGLRESGYDGPIDQDGYMGGKMW